MLYRVIVLFLFFSSYLSAAYEVTVRDITYIKGIKKNIVSGYGLVVGLDGTGDSRNELTRKTINKYLAHNGMDMSEERLLTENAAVVAVSAALNGFIRKGDLIDVQAASIGDAESIDNGMLLQTVLRGPDKEIYVVVNGIVNSGSGENINPRRGVVASGGIVERAAGRKNTYMEQNDLVLVLKKASVANVSRLKQKIEEENSKLQAEIIDYKQLRLVKKDNTALKYETIAAVMDLKLKIKSIARVIIDKQTGVVVAGDNVRVDSAFVSLPGMNVQIEEEKKLNNVLSRNNTVSELATAFNNLGVEPEEVVSIFLALKKCGALNAEIIVQ
ncbi:MAG TPA: flagellar basal body P-ring protein FlgI [Spirochaetota bacterium]|nr:flagellar basal body P-ring protein FlgI [Spirochaetota bacterium]